MRRAAALLLALLIALMPSPAFAEDTLREGVEDVLRDTDTEALEELFSQYADNGVAFEDIIMTLSEEGFTTESLEAVIGSLEDVIRRELVGSVGVFLQMILLLMMLGVAKTLGDGMPGGASRTACFAVFALVAALSVGVLSMCVSRAGQTLSAMTDIVEAVTPVLIVLLTALGGNASSALFSPTMAALTGGVFMFARNVIFPLTIIGAVFSAASAMGSTVKLSGFSKLIYGSVKWLLGAVSTVFVGMTALKGFTGAALDGVTIRTAKYAMDNGIPIVGGMVSDTADTVAACSLILKNSIGVAGLLIIAAAILAPLIYLSVNILMLRISEAVAEPFAGGDGAKLLSGIATSVTLIFATLTVCAMMAFIAIGLMMGAANASIMMR